MALFDAFLKLDGIKGESADAKHKGEIDIMSFSWGMNQTGTHSSGGGGGAGKVSVHDISITKKTDFSSPALMLHCASGKHIPEAHLTVRKAGGEPLEFMKIKLTDVLVSSYKPHVETGVPGATNEMPIDQFSLNFAKIEYAYQMQGPDGKPQGGPAIAGWDVKANQKA
jgi:type VI secretion system secreted protein Hcp